MPQTPPAFAFGCPGQGHHHRPTFSSPLSSSPIRASSLSPPPFQHHQQQITSQPLSPCNPNSLNTLALPRHTQSSPILGPASTQSPFNENTTTQNNNPKFRFAARNPRPNPVLKRREDAQEGRRRLFFHNVRQRQEDRRWEMRGGEDEVRFFHQTRSPFQNLLLKLEWWRLHRERTQAKEAELAQYDLLGVLDADAVAREEEEMRMQEMEELEYPPHDDRDALMADAIAQQEEAEMEALVSALEGQAGSGSGSGSGHFSDDEDYDGLFMDLIQQQQQQHEDEEGQGMGDSPDVEMS
ncbi:hypothetical protein C8A01DRAFT_19172 [Parachaetomium inaequale]|uniref:Uncharacterized protein n=1 Tax=Parachaetomium inaequale TaxID=2588326 RepID=A0AAN6SNM3_9PEZI|nr:hypothetical protein C8A01DRAFT_19172 [Parachaetomium inaequale]